LLFSIIIWYIKLIKILIFMHAVLFVCRKEKNKDTKIEQEWERADARYKRNELGRAREEACFERNALERARAEAE
jgi:uncharacterized membrane protein